MKNGRTYLDYNASAPLRAAAREAVVSALDLFGNASSIHGEGRQMRGAIEQARAQVAALVGAEVENVVFTSGATEAAHLALTPEIRSDGTLRSAGKLYILASEHPCVLVGGRFAPDDIVQVPVLPNGLINMAAFDSLLAAHTKGVPYVAIQLVNSETGVIQPVAEVAQKTRLMGGYTFCDGVQALGRIPVDIKALGVDYLAISSHKIGGPQGVGALICAHSILSLPPAIKGGGQEMNRRAGTENVAAISGFGAAAVEAGTESQNTSQIKTMRDSIEERLIPICASLGLQNSFQIFGGDAERVGNTLLYALEGITAETALIAFDLDGIALSSGSACSSGKVGSSHVLSAMDVTENAAQSAIRVSIGWNTTTEDTDKFIAAFERIAKRVAQKRDAMVSGAA